MILTSNNSALHLPTCRVVGEAASPAGSDDLAGDWHRYAGMADAVRDEAPLVFCPCRNPCLIDKIDALNRSGTFLHGKIYRMLDNLGCRTTAEHPVRVAPFAQDPPRRLAAAPLPSQPRFNARSPKARNAPPEAALGGAPALRCQPRRSLPWPPSSPH